MRLTLRRLRTAILFIAIVLAASAAGLALAPKQAAHVYGQNVQIGFTAPQTSWRGPAPTEVSGQTAQTRVKFSGPVRLHLVLPYFDPDALPRIHLNQAALKSGDKTVLTSKLQPSQRDAQSVQTALLHCILWAGLIAFGLALVLSAMVWPVRRTVWRRRLLQTPLIAIGIIAGVTSLTAPIAFSAQPALANVKDLYDLLGSGPGLTAPRPIGPARPDVHIVVIGDSVGAGYGNPVVTNPSVEDKICNRSSDSFAALLARTNHTNVLNLACSSATVSSGILGWQTRGGRRIAPQIDRLLRAPNAQTIIVSVGSNDVRWSDQMLMCYVQESCNDSGSYRYFMQRLMAFKNDYATLLGELGTLPQHPQIIVNLYYEAAEPGARCPDATAMQVGGKVSPQGGQIVDGHQIDSKINTLNARLNLLNRALISGADTYNYQVASPDFTGHGLCSAEPYVFNLNDDGAFHPNAPGQLAIALADEATIENAPVRVSAAAGSPSSH